MNFFYFDMEFETLDVVFVFEFGIFFEGLFVLVEFFVELDFASNGEVFDNAEESEC